MNEHTLPIAELARSEGNSEFYYRLFRSVLCREDFSAELYSVTVTEICGTSVQAALLCDVAKSETEASAVLVALAENTVSPLHAEELFAEISLLSE